MTKKMMVVAFSWTVLVLAACNDAGDSNDARDSDSGTDGPECEAALDDCAYGCTDEACALECGATLDGERETTFDALVTCMAEAGCGFNDTCLDAECSAEFGAFDALCG